jgi:hypothetical protein
MKYICIKCFISSAQLESIRNSEKSFSLHKKMSYLTQTKQILSKKSLNPDNTFPVQTLSYLYMSAYIFSSFKHSKPVEIFASFRFFFVQTEALQLNKQACIHFL